ncbi:MAG: hypothetical protein WA160_12595 [Pseudobdellovibrio sp.]
MKLLSQILIILFATTSLSAQEKSPGAYDKLKAMFDSSDMPISLAAVYTKISNISACASSSQQFPDEISYSEIPIKVTFAKPSFGPNFPSETLIGIAFKSNSQQIAGSPNFFLNYSEKISNQTLELNTLFFSTGEDCDSDSEGFNSCLSIFKSENTTPRIRLTSKYLVYSNKDYYAYCWEK